jgi:hypothetical protein
VIRDQYALNQSEVSAWDFWRSALGPHLLAPDRALETTDLIALDPEAAVDTTLTPPWLA